MGSEPRTFVLEVNLTILCTVDTPPLERSTGTHFNACPDVLVLGSNPQIEFSYFQFSPSYHIKWGSAGQKMWNSSQFCVASLHQGHATHLCIIQFLYM